MPKMLEIEGKKFNKLTAIEPCGKNKYGLWLWKFRCDCGRITIASAAYVKGNKIRSCGCSKQERWNKRKNEETNRG